ncbi:MAG: Xaa-Pro peptidase family protein [Bacillota bacterium]|nr:Xaa-Pro peptidase family protein [Bacillota bacterium]
MFDQPTADTLTRRQQKLMQAILKDYPSIETVLVTSKINQYYLTGTMQEGLLVLRKDGYVRYFVRKSYERAGLECPLDIVVKVNSYRDMLPDLPTDLGSVGLETELVTLATVDKLEKYFKIASRTSIDRHFLFLRSVKSDQELAIISESGRQHANLLNKIVPGMLCEGMSETDLLAEVYAAMVKQGHHGVSRFAMAQMELIVGQLGFGENSLYPTNFNGPGGMRGLSPAVPIIGDRERRLKKGDLIFIDVGYGVEGYHSDKTQVYSFGSEPSCMAKSVHEACRSLMRKIWSLLKPGAIPATIYQTVIAELPDELSRYFMGYADDPVKFLGHGVGLQIGEAPVIAAGINEPLEKNMVIAIEPKCGIPGQGMVGVEETFVITDVGARCLTGGDRDIVVVDC